MKSTRESRSCLLRSSLFLAGLMVLVAVGSQIAMWIGLNDDLLPMQLALPLILLIFVLAAAVPFVPGAEIGLALLLLFGADVAFEVYLSMVAALSLAYCLGRFVPPALLIRQRTYFRWNFRRSGDRRPASGSIGWLAFGGLRMIGRHRLAALGIALNMPGNALLGGGGGLAMMAGASRLYSPAEFVLTVAIAVSPVPLGFAAMGWFGLSLPEFWPG